MPPTRPDPLAAFYRQTVPDELSGEPPEAASRPALLCVDLQGLDASRDQGIFRGMSAEDQRYYFDRLEKTVVPNVERLQRAFREAGHEVVHVRIQSLTPDGRDRGQSHKRLGIHAAPGSADARFLPPVAPRSDEIVVNKTSSGVFESTKLDYVLHNVGVDALVVVGVYTNECVSTAARVGSDLGFYITVVEDACASVTPELHEHALESLRDRYARIADTEEILREARAEATLVASPSAGGGAPDSGPRRRGRGRAIVLVGGGALAPNDEPLTMAAQFDRADRALERMLPLFEDDRELVFSHGNGPQVGHMLTRVEAALGEAYSIPLEVCVAESEGELGYVLVQSLHNVLRRHGLERSVTSLLTQTLVDPDDPALAQPVKPIGPVYDAESAARLRDQGFAMTEARDGHWRRVVPSPEPQGIVEVDVVQELLRAGVIVVAAGGGGIPVFRTPEGGLDGLDAVVDKDLVGALLACALGADEMIVLTSVPCAYLDFDGPDPRPLERVTASEVERLAAEGHFGAGTMAPKMEAGRRFAMHGGTTLICDIDHLADALEGRAGTRIVPDPLL